MTVKERNQMQIAMAVLMFGGTPSDAIKAWILTGMAAWFASHIG